MKAGDDGSCPKVGSFLGELHFGKPSVEAMTLNEKVRVLKEVQKAGYQVFSRGENWRFGARSAYEGVGFWNCMDVGTILPREMRCST